MALLIAIAALQIGCAAKDRLTDRGVSDAVSPDSTSKSSALEYYLSATLSEQAGELQEAAYQYQLAMLFDPTSIEIPQALSRVYLRLGEKFAALRVLEEALARNPKNPDLLAASAELSLRTGDIKGSSEFYRKLSGVKPLDREETLRQLLLLERSEKREEALKLAQDYLERFGPDPIIYERIGLIHIGRRDFEAADSAFKKLVGLDPNNHRILFVLGGFCVAREDYIGAEAYFKRAVEIEPGESRYWTNLIMTINQLEKDDTLKIVLEDAIRLFPDAPQFYDGRAGLRQRKADWNGALEDARKSASLDSTRLQPYLSIGYICHQMNDWKGSEEAYKRAMEIAPESPVVLNNYAYMLSVQNVRLDEALVMVDKALEAAPDTPSYRDTRGWILHRLGRNEEAVIEIEAALKEDAGNAELYEHLASIYKALGRTADASNAEKKAAELNAAGSR